MFMKSAITAAGMTSGLCSEQESSGAFSLAPTKETLKGAAFLPHLSGQKIYMEVNLLPGTPLGRTYIS